jgi:hypothetical protein
VEDVKTPVPDPLPDAFHHAGHAELINVGRRYHLETQIGVVGEVYSGPRIPACRQPVRSRRPSSDARRNGVP